VASAFTSSQTGLPNLAWRNYGAQGADQRPVLADRDETLEAAFDALAHIVVERPQVSSDFGRRKWRARASSTHAISGRGSNGLWYRLRTA
jgi:hypothetical protein